MAKRIRWYYPVPSVVILGERWPQEVEDKGDLAIPLQQTEGLFTYILWPQGTLYDSEREALAKAIDHYQGIASDATKQARQLTKRLMKLSQ